MRLSEVKPPDDEVKVMLEVGAALREHGHFSKAEDVFRGLSELLPQAAEPRVGLATVLLHLHRFEEAERLCAEALRLRPDSLRARLLFGEALLHQRRRDEGEEELRQVVAADPESADGREARALLDAAYIICDPELSKVWPIR
jgi:tetratricopeptide (TPR) repeat protein